MYPSLDRPSGKAGEPSAKEAIHRLTRHLSEDRISRFFLSMQKRFAGLHMKDLVAQEMDDQRRIRFGNHTVTNFGSDSFLGLDRDRRVQEAIARGLKTWGTHNGSARGFYSVEACAETERRLARWLGVEDTLVFPSVTLANLGALPAVTAREDLLIVDALAHDSVQEAAKISAQNGAHLKLVSPCTVEGVRSILESCEYQSCLLAVDGVYSMTGTTIPLRALDELVRANRGLLYIDDAHGTGVVGERGTGVARRELGHLDGVLAVGSLSKAFSCMGA